MTIRVSDYTSLAPDNSQKWEIGHRRRLRHNSFKCFANQSQSRLTDPCTDFVLGFLSLQPTSTPGQKVRRGQWRWPGGGSYDVLGISTDYIAIKKSYPSVPVGAFRDLLYDPRHYDQKELKEKKTCVCSHLPMTSDSRESSKTFVCCCFSQLSVSMTTPPPSNRHTHT